MIQSAIVNMSQRAQRQFSSGITLVEMVVVVAIIGRNHPLLIIAASFFLAYLRVGGQVLNLNSDVPSEMVTVLQWIIILLITAEAFLSRWRFRIMVRQAERSEEAR